MKIWFRRLFLKITAIANNPSKRRSKLHRDRRLVVGLTDGFTLIELIVAALIATFMVVVMLSFLVGVLDSDRRETAKSNAQEELQAAIAYIADDLQEAMYIYGAEGLMGINDQLPHKQTDPNDNSQTCNSTNCTPVLVFWKRISFPPDTVEKYSKSGADPKSEKLGCMPYKDPSDCRSTSVSKNPYESAFGREVYAYSLVAYYLKNDVSLGSSVWSNTARILRWEISDGYPWYCSTGGTITDTANCPTNLADQRDATSSSVITTPVILEDKNYYFIEPDQGFNRPDFSSATSILSWKKFTDYNLNTNKFLTLVDFMDDTAYDATQGGNNDAGSPSTATAALRIPVGKNVTISGVVTNPDCDDPSIGVGNPNPVTTTNATGTVTQRVPADFTSATANPAGLSSFYACVAPKNVTVRLFMRGNALARMGTTTPQRNSRKPNEGNTSFFPTANMRSFGRSAIGIK